jgi:hypothetical protein
MSSESSDRKPESIEPGPPSGAKARRSSRAPSAWGQVRDAVSSVHNLAALLRSPSVKYKVIRDLLPELRQGARVLVELFTPQVGDEANDEATKQVCAYGLAVATGLEQLLDATDLANDEREDLTACAMRQAGELEAATDLLALLDRAGSPAPTSVSLRLVVRETQRLWGGARGGELAVRLDESTPDASVDVDPYVVGPLLSLVLALSQAAGAGDVVVRASGSAAGAVLSVGPAGSADAALRTVPVRVLPAVAPTEMTARHVAAAIGAVLELEGAHAVLRFPQGSG